MTLWDYLHIHPWIALLHSLALAIIIMIAMHAAIGAINVWFGAARRLRDLEEAFSWLRGTEHSAERMAAMTGAMMVAMQDFHTQKPKEDSDGEEAEAS